MLSDLIFKQNLAWLFKNYQSRLYYLYFSGMFLSYTHFSLCLSQCANDQNHRSPCNHFRQLLGGRESFLFIQGSTSRYTCLKTDGILLVVFSAGCVSVSSHFSLQTNFSHPSFLKSSVTLSSLPTKPLFTSFLTHRNK